jgi:hypothetical protein
MYARALEIAKQKLREALEVPEGSKVPIAIPGESLGEYSIPGEAIPLQDLSTPEKPESDKATL